MLPILFISETGTREAGLGISASLTDDFSPCVSPTLSNWKESWVVHGDVPKFGFDGSDLGCFDPRGLSRIAGSHLRPSPEILELSSAEDRVSGVARPV